MNSAAMSNLDTCYVILRTLSNAAAQNEHEVLESVVFASVWAPRETVDEMIGELLDMGCIRSTVDAATHKPALVLTDRGLGTFQEMVQRRAA